MPSKSLFLSIIPILFLLLLTLNHSNLAQSKATGAPFESCLTLTPKHGSQPSQPAPTSPFVINATKHWDETLGVEKVEVSITSPVNGTLFRGFVVQARFANNPDILVDGEFIVNESLLSRAYTCRPGEHIKRNNTWTHNTNKEKERVTAVWTPPEDFGEPVVFVGTVVKDKATFWEGQFSQPVFMGNLVGLENGEASGDNSSSATVGEEPGHDNHNKEGGPPKKSAMDESQFASSNFTEMVASGSLQVSLSLAALALNLVLFKIFF